MNVERLEGAKRFFRCPVYTPGHFFIIFTYFHVVGARADTRTYADTGRHLQTDIAYVNPSCGKVRYTCPW